MHGTAFLIDRDVVRNDGNFDFVANPKTLVLDILDGRQVLPARNDNGANRLVIFTGTVSVEQSASGDDIDRGVVRVRLQFPVSDPKDPVGSVVFRGSASVAALATVNGNEANITVGADAAEIVTDPTAPSADGTPQPPSNGLPSPELYLIIDAAVASDQGTIGRIAYQANVLIEDKNPDLASILVRANEGQQFAPNAAVEIGRQWEFQINLTGPVVDASGFTVTVQSDNDNVLIVAGLVFPSTSGVFTLSQNQKSAFFVAPPTGFAPGVTATITASANGITKNATVALFELR